MSAPPGGAATAEKPSNSKGNRTARGGHVTKIAPSDVSITPALLSLEQAAIYMNVSYWTVRDWALNGTLSAVRLPAARVDAGPRRGEDGTLPPERVLVKAGDHRIADRRIRRLLLRRAELDQLIARSTERAKP
jgi:excisionase family DNA binding protein